jgi:hypothetical protein
MCNPYSITKSQDAIRRLFGVTRDHAGNLPPLPASSSMVSRRSCGPIATASASLKTVHQRHYEVRDNGRSLRGDDFPGRDCRA